MFKEIDRIDNIQIADSFVKYNKIGMGSGEARLYISSQSDVQKVSMFEFDRSKDQTCFILKKDLIHYLQNVKYEYMNPTEKYRHMETMSDNWNAYDHEVSLMESKIFFSIYDISDKNRFYIRSNDPIFMNTIRAILLPIFSTISIIKVEYEGKNYYWFIPFFDNQHYHYLNKLTVSYNVNLKEHITEKFIQTKARIGQADFRKKLLENMPRCAFTEIDDERLLIASHIKPWVNSNDIEKLDYFNGLSLSPTVDKLFDNGFISFNQNSEVICSPYFAKDNFIRAGIVHNKKINIPNFDERFKYIAYHNKNIFRSYED